MTTLKNIARSLATPRLLLAAGLLLAASAAPAMAQRVVARVNGANITSFDVTQRIKLEALISNNRLSPKQALDVLIDDKLKVLEGRRMGYKLSDADIDNELTRIARNNRQTKDQLEGGLRQRGVDPIALRDRLAADLVWNAIVPYRARSLSPSNEVINAEIAARVAKGEARVHDYGLNQVIFVVPGANPAVAAQRQRDAEAARKRFSNCESGLDMLRGMRDVAVKPPVFRSSTDVPKQMADLLAKTAVGHLTQPYRTDQGIEMIAVCERKERNDETAIRKQVEEDLNKKRSGNLAESIIKELREKATIKRF
jgi:peptidyl-prolyl cis-trans isomerase SurA